MNLFVAGFIGSPQMNFMDVQIQSEGGKLYAVMPGAKLLVPDAKVNALKPYVGKTVTMGLRPENFLPASEAKEENVITAKVDFCELLGAETNLYLYVNDTKVIVKMPSSEPHPVDDVIKVPANMARAHFFDKDTELAICH